MLNDVIKKYNNKRHKPTTSTTNNQKKKHHNQEVSSTQVCTWIVIGVFLLGLLILLIVLLSYPYPNTNYYRHAALVKGDKQGRINCTVGEYYDQVLDICGPLAPAPIPILDEIKNLNVRPCDSFFNYVSGKWLNSHQNENRAFTFAHRKNQKFIHDIIRDPSSGPVYTFYRSCLDTIVNNQHTFLDKAQIKHIREHILGAFKTHGDLPVVFARLTQYGFTAPFLFTITPHPTSTRMVPMIRKSVLENAPLADKFNSWASQDSDFEGDSFVDYVRSDYFKRDMTSMSVLLDASPPMFWEQFLRELNGYQMEKEMLDPKTEPLWLLDRNYITSLLHHLETISVTDWRTHFEYVIEHHTAEFIPELPSDSYIHIHNFGYKRRHPHHMLRRDEKTETECLKATHQLFPAMIGNIYIHRHIQNYTTVKTQVTQVAENIRRAFVDMIRHTDWLSQESQQRVIDKLNAIIVRVIHPNYYEEEPFAKRMTMDNYLRNLNIIRRYVATRNFELWTKNTPNRDEIQRFGSPISTVNAFYSPVTNTVTVFAGILTKPFYSPDFDPVALYAGIGMIIGHELGGHGLDRESRLFDKNGLVTLIDPWTKTEQEEFSKRVQLLIDEYDAPFGCVNEEYGEQTIREDMADLSGITAAYLALKKEVPTLTKAQTKQFFEVFGQMWAENYDKEFYCQRVTSDEHAVGLYRVDKTLRQLSLYRETYGCKPNDPMVSPNPAIIYGKIIN